MENKNNTSFFYCKNVLLLRRCISRIRSGVRRLGSHFEFTERVPFRLLRDLSLTSQTYDCHMTRFNSELQRSLPDFGASQCHVTPYSQVNGCLPAPNVVLSCRRGTTRLPRVVVPQPPRQSRSLAAQWVKRCCTVTVYLLVAQYCS